MRPLALRRVLPRLLPSSVGAAGQVLHPSRGDLHQVRRRLFMNVSVAALIAIVLGSTAYMLLDARRNAYNGAVQAATNIALGLEHDVRQTIDSLDLSLRALAARATQPELPSLDIELRRAFLFGSAAAKEHLEDLFVTDETGQLIYDSASTVPRPVNIGDRLYFQAQMQPPGAGLFISEPLQRRTTGEWALVMSQRVTRPDGSFAGVAIGVLSLKHLSSLLAKLDLGEEGNVSLFNLEGRLVIRQPYIENSIGRDFSAAPVFRKLSQAPYGFYENYSAVDGVRRLYAYRQVGPYPLIVTVGLSTREVYADWNAKAAAIGAAMLLLTGIAATLVWNLKRELSRRLAAEQAARRSEHEHAAALARLHALFHNVSDVLFVARVEPGGGFTLEAANPAAERLAGQPAGAMVGRSPGAFLRPVVARAVLARWRQCAAERQPLRYSHVIALSGGRSAWDVLVAPVLDDAGQVRRLIGAGRDVTARRRLEAESQAQANELRAVNAALDRSARHLARARDEAERASRAKSRFLAGMSHELRTPLNGILGYAQLLRLEGGLASQQERRVDAMLGAGQHLLDMINRVLDLSEIEAERVELHLTALDPYTLVEACLDHVRPMAEARAITLHLLSRADIPRLVMADATRLRQVLMNLLGNAVKFTAQGSVRLRLQSADGGGLRIEVADTGPGIPVEKREQLFQDFERLGSDTAVVEGAGLGLAISARLARLMGGRMGYENNPGGGSVFWLELPCEAASEPTSAVTADVQELPLMPALRLLVVDDVAMNRDIAASFLRAAGHDVVCAEGGREAVELAVAESFDVVLMDVRMPGVDGLEATRRIRALAGPRGRVPIVALTAQVFAEQVAECRSAGMDSHLAKPFTPAALLDAVARAAAIGADRVVADPVASKTAPAGAAAITEVASEPSSDLPVFNQITFERTAVFLRPADVANYLQTLAERVEDLLARLCKPDALVTDASGLAEAAHALAGSTGMFGFERAAAVARLFENAAQKASPEAQALAEQLTLALEATLEALRQRSAVAV